MTWMMNTYGTLGQDYWRYPEYQNDWAVRNIDRLSGPWSTYDAIVCSNASVYYDYRPFGSAYINGTLRDDVVNSGFPFDDLFDKPPGNSIGYTHGESKSPQSLLGAGMKSFLSKMFSTHLQSSTTRTQIERCTRTIHWPTTMSSVD
jgi:hypothetical protein